jgi:hypothetical protein
MRTGIALFSTLLLGALFACSRPFPSAARSGSGKAADSSKHWSFQPVKRPPLPALTQPGSPIRNPIDAFLLAKLGEKGLTFAPEADRATLLRRVTYDLTGVLPTPGELAAFLTDSRSDAYELVVERLLASPHYGERWAQHWLDVVRYAESNGYELDKERPHAWRYRDWVARSLNADKSYDVFITEQLAGDLLAHEAVRKGITSPEQAEASLLVAAGFNRCGPIHLVSGNIDPVVARQEVLTEMVTSVGAAFLGLTVHCARCHDHKFDPFTQGDYYRLQAFFSTAQPKEVDLASPDEKAAHARTVKEIDGKIAPLKARVGELEAPYRQRLTEARKAELDPATREALALDAAKRTPEQTKLAAQAQVLIKVTWDEVVAALTPEDRDRRAEWREQIHALEMQKPAPPAQAWTLGDTGGTPFAHVLKRGDPHQKGQLVEPDVPALFRSLAPMPPAPETPDKTPPSRLDLARWLTRPDHPLTGRVLVNRLWQHHFGRGLAETPNDFGIRGTEPTHPELLDWLAVEFVENGWSLKHMHRLMVLSQAYRQSSNPKSEIRNPKSTDPDNKLLWRMNRRRMEAEGLRDCVLAASGTLNPALCGPFVRAPLEPEVYDLIFTEDEPVGLWPVTPDARQHVRRTLYLFNKRNVRLPLLEAFNQPDTLTSCPVRPVSTFAPQALLLLNGPFMREQARAFASRLLHEGGKEPAGWIEYAYRVALSRPPRTEEREQALTFLTGQADLIRERLLARLPVGLPPEIPPTVDPALAAALADFCLALLNRNEFVYVR